MVTQNDVAKKAGVSFITVSRVINNSSNVKKETREKVLKVIKELNYYPNNMARGLNKNKISVVGIIVPYSTHIFGTPYYVDLLSGIEQCLAEKNYELLFYPKQQEDKYIDYAKLFYERKVDGILIIAPKINDKQLLDIDKKGIPAVVINGRIDAENISWVDSNNEQGGYVGTEYLIGNRHSVIGFISGLEFMKNGLDRMQGYKTALKHYNIKQQNLIVSGNFTEYSGYIGAKELLKRNKKITAIFAANDLMAIGAMRYLSEQKINIPEEISIIGFDDIQIGAYMQPALTTIKQSAYEMGYFAAGELIKKIHDNTYKGKNKIFNVKLVIRESVARR